jgi:hypothetical protein
MLAGSTSSPDLLPGLYAQAKVKSASSGELTVTGAPSLAVSMQLAVPP